jgi:hypothetical protein
MAVPAKRSDTLRCVTKDSTIAQFPTTPPTIRSDPFYNSKGCERVGWSMILHLDDTPIGIHRDCVAILATLTRIVEYIIGLCGEPSTDGHHERGDDGDQRKSFPEHLITPSFPL